MKFDSNQFIYAYDEGNVEGLRSLAESYRHDLICTNEGDSEFLEILLNLIIDRIYTMPDREVQGDYFEVLSESIALNAGKYKNLYHCVDRLIHKIEKVSMNSWELAKTLLIVSATRNKRYSRLMKDYKKHEDAYVREVAKNFFHNHLDSGKRKV